MRSKCTIADVNIDPKPSLMQAQAGIPTPASISIDLILGLLDGHSLTVINIAGCSF
jgi:hypothetical protein